MAFGDTVPLFRLIGPQCQLLSGWVRKSTKSKQISAFNHVFLRARFCATARFNFFHSGGYQGNTLVAPRSYGSFGSHALKLIVRPKGSIGPDTSITLSPCAKGRKAVIRQSSLHVRFSLSLPRDGKGCSEVTLRDGKDAREVGLSRITISDLFACFANRVLQLLTFCAAAFQTGAQFVQLLFSKQKSRKPGSNALNLDLSLIPFPVCRN